MRYSLKHFSLLLAFFLLSSAPRAAAASEAVSFSQIASGLSSLDNTPLAAERFWHGWRGRRVTWDATITAVRLGRTRQQIYLAHPDGLTYRGYNIVLSTADYNVVSNLSTGQMVRFTGALERYKARRGSPMVVVLGAGRIEGIIANPPPSPPLNQSATSTRMSFEQFVDMVDVTQNTRLAVRHNWAGLKGMPVVWEGEVVDVRASRGRAVIYIANP